VPRSTLLNIIHLSVLSLPVSEKIKMPSNTDNPALAFNEEDGTAVDPIAFRDALIADPDKMKVIEEDKELCAALLSDDTARIQVRLGAFPNPDTLFTAPV
jgi:hypothetical protein